MYKNNGAFIAKSQIGKYNKGLCLTEWFVLIFNPTVLIQSRSPRFEKTSC